MCFELFQLCLHIPRVSGLCGSFRFISGTRRLKLGIPFAKPFGESLNVDMRQILLAMLLILCSCKSFELKPEARNVRMFPGNGSLFTFVLTNPSKCKFIAVGTSDLNAKNEEEAINDVKNQTAALDGNLVFGEYIAREGQIFPKVQIGGSSSWTGQGPLIYHCNDLDAVIAFDAKAKAEEREARKQEEESRKETAKAPALEDQGAAVLGKWLKDSATIMEMIADARQFRWSNDDSEVQRQEKKKALAASLKKLYGRPFTISAARLDDVKPVKVLHRGMLSNGLDCEKDCRIYDNVAGCQACFTETGRFEATYSILVPVEDGTNTVGVATGELDQQSHRRVILNTKIKKIIQSKSVALAMHKGAMGPLSGMIRAVNYYETFGTDESVEIEIQ